MNFTELQMELRSIEEHISQLHNEIEGMKPQIEEEKKTDFESINRLAKKHPVKNTKLTKTSQEIKHIFMRGLAYLLVTEETDAYDRLLYLTRLSIGCGLDMTAEEIYKNGLEFKAADIERLCTELSGYKYTYLVEAFIVANLSAEPAVDMWFVIADIAKAMGLEKEELRVTAQVAKAKLTDNQDILKGLPALSKNRWSNQFTDYISHDWIVKQRVECGRICTLKFEFVETNDERTMAILNGNSDIWTKERHPCEITKRLKAGSVVKKGDILCVYTEKVKKTSETGLFTFFMFMCKEDDSLYDKKEKTLIAPCDGIVFFIEDKINSKVAEKMDEYLSIYVVSYFDEYEDFCKWYRNGCK